MTQSQYTIFRHNHPELHLPHFHALMPWSRIALAKHTEESLYTRRCEVLLSRGPGVRDEMMYGAREECSF